MMTVRSAGLQPAVSQVWNLRPCRTRARRPRCARSQTHCQDAGIGNQVLKICRLLLGSRSLISAGSGPPVRQTRCALAEMEIESEAC